MGFNITRWKNTGRNWGRGAPPPRGSIEYVAVGDMFDPGPSRTSSGAIWTITATEIEAANRWNDTLARSVDYARQVHGDKILSPQDAAAFTDYFKRWKTFAGKVGTWSLYDRSLEANKSIFEALMLESKRLNDRFVKQGMATIPAPYMTELTLLLRRMPKQLTPEEMAAKVKTAVEWARKMISSSRSTGEWIQKAGISIPAAGLLGPAGLLIAYHLPTSWSRDRKDLESAISAAEKLASLYAKSGDKSVPFMTGSPVYDEFMRRVAKIYIEASGLYGVQEVQRAAAAESVDTATDTVERVVDRARKSTSFAWNHYLALLALAGVSYLGLQWLTRPKSPTITLKVPDAAPKPFA